MARSYDEALERAKGGQKLLQSSTAMQETAAPQVDSDVVQEKVAAQAIPINSKHKDAFFKKVYESEKRQKNLVAYLLGVGADNIRLANIRPIILGEKENDLALLCDNIIYIMIECQSTLSPNMAYRLLEYIAAGLRELKDMSKVLYSSTQIMFPIPKLYTLQVGLVHKEEDLSKGVTYDLRLSDSYEKLNGDYEGKKITADLEVIVHVYDFRMTLEEMYSYIQDGLIPERFIDYDKDMRNYALTANGITYMQRVKKAEDTKDIKRCKEYKMPSNISNVTEYLKLLVKREIFIDLLLEEEEV